MNSIRCSALNYIFIYSDRLIGCLTKHEVAGSIPDLPNLKTGIGLEGGPHSLV